MSAINYTTINENYPIAGQDNDTQTFRDNFDSIKTNFRYAYEEITALQDSTAGLQLSIANDGSDFNNKTISNAVFRYNRDKIIDKGESYTSFTVDYEDGPYQIVKIADNVTMSFMGFPNSISDPRGVGKITLEIYSISNAEKVVTLDTSNSMVYKKNGWDSSWGSSTFTLNSMLDPLILEIWQHSSNLIFIKNIGKFV